MAAVLWSSVLAASLLAPSQQARADLGATHTSLVSEFASFDTPGVLDGRVEAIAVDGDTVYVGGTFTRVREPRNGDIVDQPYLFAYSRSTGNLVRDFDPVLNRKVLALETTGEGRGVFAAGAFSTLNGEGNRRGLVKIDDDGDRMTGFGARPNAQVNTLVRLDDTLYIGGSFTNVGGVSVEHLAALNTSSGAVSPGLNLDFDGTISTFYTVGKQGVDDIDITSDGRLMVVIGNFLSIDGQSRSRLALIELDGQARVSAWNTDVYDVQCPNGKFPQYIRGIDIAPDDAYVVVGSSGWRFFDRVEPACDSVVRFDLDDLNDTDVQPAWVNYTGGDTVFDVVSTDHAVYIGGHFRWLNNDTTITGNDAGPGSVPRRGLAALDPLNGLTLLDWRSDRNPRGVGVFAMIAEDEGLYLGDDTNFLNGSRHARLKFLPITSDTVARPTGPVLPTTLVSSRGGALDGSSFDGTTLGAPMPIFDGTWSNIRAAMFVGGQLFRVTQSGQMYVAPFENGRVTTSTRVDLFGLTENEWALSRIGGMFHDYERGRVYYTLRGDTRLFWRAFTPAGPYFGNEEHVAEQQGGGVSWSTLTGMDVIGGFLYLNDANGWLYRATLDGVAVVPGSIRVISSPGTDGRNWNDTALAFLSESVALKGPGNAQLEFESSGSTTVKRFRKFKFPVAPGEPVTVRLAWQDPGAQIRFFLRDANGNLIDSDTTSTGSPKWLSAPAGAGGTYTAAIVIRKGSTAYTVQVNPEQGPPPPPVPRADFDFISSGTATDGSWQVFRFDVAAGERVDARVAWNDPNARVKVFLRDENRRSVDSVSDGNGSPATMSAVAASAGRWSVAVKIKSGAIDYDVLVDTGNL